MEIPQELTPEIPPKPETPPSKPEVVQQKPQDVQTPGGPVGPQYQELKSIVKKAFDMYDADGSGDLDPEE